ncbi:hypothetical protein [Nocardia sp. NBC_01388]|uniref:hypothetical protein n=1 Tax=Nocardia sp. NBC_01388 TaxID=2903596 RepID=UPI003244C53E
MGQSFLGELADREEFRLSRELDGVVLFLELNLDEDEIRRAQEIFGGIAAKCLASGRGPAAVIRMFPALTLTSLIGHAGLAYDQGRYWESFWAELGLDQDPEFENALRGALNGLLRRFRMREFPELSGRYVRVMTMHAGIPVHCLGDLIGVIEQHLLHGRDRSGAAVFEWLTEPGMGYRLNQLDVPVRNFLQLGGEFAVDIVDRILDFIDFAVQHPDSWNDLRLDTATTGLPTVLLDGLIERLRDRPLDQGVVAAVSSIRRRTPTPAYSMCDDEITVGVPYPESSPELPWRVSFDGDTREVYAERGWGVAEDGDHPLTPVPVTRPAREAVLRHEASGVEHRIVLVDKDNPLLVFDGDGRFIPRREALPRDVVLIVHPQDSVVVADGAGVDIQSLEDVRTPAGWRGWRAHSVDLSDHDSIQLRRNGKPLGVVRDVRVQGSPVFEPAYPIEGVRTPSGLSVYSERPLVTLQSHTGPGYKDWHVRVRRSGQMRWLAATDWKSDAGEVCLDPFDGLSAGLLGLFEVVVSGPVGQDLRCVLFIAEGLQVDHGVYFRSPVPGGLTSSISRVGCDLPLQVDRELVAFDTDSRATQILVRSGDYSQKLVLEPPHFESRVDPIDSPARWRTSVHVLNPADMEAHALIAARVPGDVTVDFALVDLSGRPVQVEIPDVPSDNVFQLSSRVFVDTVRSIGSGRLIVRIDDPSGGAHEVTIAHIRPAQLCSGVRIDDVFLVFDDPIDEDLGVFVWATTAPWQPVRTLEVSDGLALLPEDLYAAGPLLVQVFVDDPWVVIPRPRGPEQSALRVDQRGWFRDENKARDELARFLSGIGPAPRSADSMAEVWASLALLPAARSDTRTELLRGALTRVLGLDSHAALKALGNSMIPAVQMVPLLIRTGLVDRAYSTGFTHVGLHANPWVGCLVEIANLPMLRRRRTEMPTTWGQTIGFLENQGGEWLLDLLGGRSGDPRVGVFDRNVERVHAFPAEQVDAMFEAFRLVPGALLDVDMRTSATIEAFHMRGQWVCDPAREVLTSGMRLALNRIRQTAPLLYDTVKARNEVLDGVDVGEHPWMLLSLQSLTMAALARLDARGRFDTPPITPEMRESWARMADLCPSMVATDLLIADAIATFVTNGDLIGDDR